MCLWLSGGLNGALRVIKEGLLRLIAVNIRSMHGVRLSCDTLVTHDPGLDLRVVFKALVDH